MDTDGHANSSNSRLSRREALHGSAAAALGISTTLLPAAAQAFSLTLNGVPRDGVTVYWSEPDRIGRLVYRGLDQGVDTIDNDWLTGLSDPRRMIADGGFLYWVVPYAGGDANEQGIWRVSLSDPSTPERVVALSLVVDFDIDGDDLFYNRSGVGIYRTNKDGSGSPTELATTGQQIFGTTVAGDDILFSESNADRIMSVPKAGGTATEFASVSSPRALWGSDSSVFVAINAGQRIARYDVDGTLRNDFSTGGFVQAIQVVDSTVFVAASNSTYLSASGPDGANRDDFASTFSTPETIVSNGVDGIAVV